eukprot:745785-Hanusia_phi.AAC.1
MEEEGISRTKKLIGKVKRLTRGLAPSAMSSSSSSSSASRAPTQLSPSVGRKRLQETAPPPELIEGGEGINVYEIHAGGAEEEDEALGSGEPIPYR